MDSQFYSFTALREKAANVLYSSFSLLENSAQAISNVTVKAEHPNTLRLTHFKGIITKNMRKSDPHGWSSDKYPFTVSWFYDNNEPAGHMGMNDKQVEIYKNRGELKLAPGIVLQ